MTPTPEEFAAICYLHLMSHHGTSLFNASPDYIAEKLPMLQDGYDAFGRLDLINQRKVVNHLRHWKYELPDVIAQYLEDISEM